MHRDMRIIGSVAIAISLLCCLPLACLSGVVVLAGGSVVLEPGYLWTEEDTLAFTVFGIALAIGLLGLASLLGGGIWAVVSARRAEKQEDEYFMK
jgi:ABC-type Na+ efflux pump permease subunit